MSKIVQAINSMITNSNKISNVDIGENSDSEEYFFTYGGKYIWSILKNDSGGFYVYYYPTANSVRDVVYLHDFSGVPMVAYGDDDLKSREGRESAQELFNLLKKKIYNIDSVLDDIIDDDLLG